MRSASSNQALAASSLSAFQILTMPVDTNQAGYVRHTGLAAGVQSLPRALLPVAMGEAGIDLQKLRDPAHPFYPENLAGDKTSKRFNCGLTSKCRATPRRMTIGQVANCLPRGRKRRFHASMFRCAFQFDIPNQPNLKMVGQIDWKSLRRFYPDKFEAITPRLMNRQDSMYSDVLKTIDPMVQLRMRID